MCHGFTQMSTDSLRYKDITAIIEEKSIIEIRSHFKNYFLRFA